MSIPFSLFQVCLLSEHTTQPSYQTSLVIVTTCAPITLQFIAHHYTVMHCITLQYDALNSAVLCIAQSAI